MGKGASIRFYDAVRALLWITLLFGGTIVVGQPFLDIAKFNHSFGPVQDDYSIFRTTSFAFQLPILIKKDAILIGSSIEDTRLENENKSVIYQLINLTFNAGFKKNLNDRQSILIMAINRFNSDEISIKSHHHQLGIIGLWEVKKSSNFTYKLGFYFNSEFFGPFVSPLFGIDLILNKNLRFFGTLPVNATLYNSKSEKLGWGVGFNGLISSFQRKENLYIQRSINDINLFADYYFRKQLVLQAKASYLVGSRFKEYDTDDEIDWALNLVKFGDDRSERSSIPVNGLLLQVALIFRYQLN
ncbi:MAG: hypothetical protein KI790_12125 [Cyclobacteriaceae bacterium]|nr:hypothetical protein [Cyclobacteriaceae bacterium HetDA_MAG_MS6]